MQAPLTLPFPGDSELSEFCTSASERVCITASGRETRFGGTTGPSAVAAGGYGPAPRRPPRVVPTRHFSITTCAFPVRFVCWSNKRGRLSFNDEAAWAAWRRTPPLRLLSEIAALARSRRSIAFRLRNRFGMLKGGCGTVGVSTWTEQWGAAE